MRVLNADDFLGAYQKLQRDYDRLFGPLIAKLRQTLTAMNPAAITNLNSSLEQHARAYVINALLAALNWRQDVGPDTGLPNLFPEVPVRSVSSDTVRFLDYLGLERETTKPLVIVEAKRPSAALPSTVGHFVSYSEAVARGIEGERLNADWNSWLSGLGDYVRSTIARTQTTPRRVVITNGDWLILFLNPANAFLLPETVVAGQIIVFAGRRDIEANYHTLFRHLEHQHVAGTAPALHVGELTFVLNPSHATKAMHGLHLKYIDQSGIFSPAPAIKLAPVLFLKTIFGSSLCVISGETEYDLPGRREHFAAHLREVRKAARRLLSDVSRQLGRPLNLESLSQHYADQQTFTAIPGVSRSGENEYRIATGDWTHYVNGTASVPACPFHDWHVANTAGVTFGKTAIAARSTSPRSFFVSTEVHHCAHQNVYLAKASQITQANRERCGTRSGDVGQAFCEIWQFETHLCCRTCVFEDVCTRAEVFRLPCERPLGLDYLVSKTFEGMAQFRSWLGRLQ